MQPISLTQYLIEEQRRKAAEEAARLAAEEEARRLEEERLLLEQEGVVDPDAESDPTSAPLDLGFQPGVNQPIGNSVNQPIQLIPGQ